MVIWGRFSGEMRMAKVDMLGRGDTFLTPGRNSDFGTPYDLGTLQHPFLQISSSNTRFRETAVAASGQQCPC